MSNPQPRTFIVHGERLIDCDPHCPSPSEEVDAQQECLMGLQKLDGIKGKGEQIYVPACLSVRAPLQGEGPDRLLRKDRGVQFSRACLHHAQRIGDTLVVKQNRGESVISP